MPKVETTVKGKWFALGEVGPKKTKDHKKTYPDEAQHGIKVRTPDGDMFIPIPEAALAALIAEKPPELSFSAGIEVQVKIELEILGKKSGGIDVKVSP